MLKSPGELACARPSPHFIQNKVKNSPVPPSSLPDRSRSWVPPLPPRTVPGARDGVTGARRQGSVAGSGVGGTTIRVQAGRGQRPGSRHRAQRPSLQMPGIGLALDSKGGIPGLCSRVLGLGSHRTWKQDLGALQASSEWRGTF